MKSELLEEIKSLVTFPVYLFIKTPMGFNCDKLILGEKKEFLRTRYILLPNQCSCLGWLKSKDTPQTCKHLKMLAGEFSWASSGIPKDYILDEVNRIIETVGKKFPESSKFWGLDASKIPDNLLSLEFRIAGETNPNIERLCYVKEVVSGLKIGISFINKSS